MALDFLGWASSRVTCSQLETCSYLEQEKAFESGGAGIENGADSIAPKPEKETDFGGAKVGDLVQWESHGVLQMEKPMRVRLVQTVDGIEYVAVEGHEAGIPMSEVIIEERAVERPTPPTFKLGADKIREEQKPSIDGSEWMRNRVGRDTTVALMVSGEMGPKEIGHLIKLLEAQKAVLG